MPFHNHRITKVEGPDMKEGIQDSFRQWYMESKRTTGSLPEFPADEVWQQSDFKFSSHAQTPGNDEAAQAAAAAKEEQKAKDKKGKKDGEEVEESFRYDNSEFITNIKKK